MLCHEKHDPLSDISLRHAHNFRCMIFPNRQLFKVFRIRYHKAFFVCQMQNTNETERRGDVCHCLLRIHRLQTVDHLCEFVRPITILKWGLGRESCVFFTLLFGVSSRSHQQSISRLTSSMARPRHISSFSLLTSTFLATRAYCTYSGRKRLL